MKGASNSPVYKDIIEEIIALDKESEAILASIQELL